MISFVGKGRVRKSAGRWQAVVELYDDSLNITTMKTKLTQVPCYADSNRGKSAALEVLNEFKKDVARRYRIGTAAETQALDLAEMTIPEGIEHYVEYLLKSERILDVTSEGYGYSLKHIRDGFEHMRVADLTSSDVMDWIVSKARSGTSANTMKKAYKLLNQFYRHVTKLEGSPVTVNPVDKVPSPKPHEPPKNPLRRDSIKKLNRYLERAADDDLKRACVLALNTGMRVGEVSIVRWGDVDWINGTVLIQHAVSRVKNKLKEKETKGRERRYAPMSPFLYSYLKSIHDKDLARYKSMLIESPEEVLASRPIISSYEVTADDHLNNPNAISRRFTSLSKLLHLVGTTGETVTFHGLRHTFATQWIASGGDVAALSNILGHKDVAFTIQVYVSVDPIAKLNGALSSSIVLSDGWSSLPWEGSTPLRDVCVRITMPTASWHTLAELAARDGVTVDDEVVRMISKQCDARNIDERSRAMFSVV